MLDEKGIEYHYRDYKKEPLDAKELRRLLKQLGVKPAALLRKKDKAYKALGLTGQEPDKELIAHLAEHPTLLERPIGVLGDRAVVGRPIENLLELAD